MVIEYLLTYGWVLIVAVVVGTALLVMGGQEAPHPACYGFSKLLYIDHSLDSDGLFHIAFKNGIGEQIRVESVEFGGDFNGIYSGSGNAVGAAEGFEVSSIVSSGEEGSSYSGTIAITFIKQRTGLRHTDYGICTGKRERGRGLCQDVNCNDANPCTVDSCRLGECTNSPMPDGANCGFQMKCLGGVCAPEALQNQPPVADAGADQSVSAGAVVALDGSASYDPDGNIASYEWSEGGNVFGTEALVTGIFPAGAHTITLTVTDDSSATASDDVVVNVGAVAGLCWTKEVHAHYPEWEQIIAGDYSSVKTTNIAGNGLAVNSAYFLYITNNGGGWTKEVPVYSDDWNYLVESDQNFVKTAGIAGDSTAVTPERFVYITNKTEGWTKELHAAGSDWENIQAGDYSSVKTANIAGNAIAVSDDYYLYITNKDEGWTKEVPVYFNYPLEWPQVIADDPSLVKTVNIAGDDIAITPNALFIGEWSIEITGVTEPNHFLYITNRCG